MKYAFWNNKGGTGKTSLAFQTICSLAETEHNERILVVDVCPQANLSELFLGSLQGQGSNHLHEIQSRAPRATIGGYFQLRLPSPYRMIDLSREDFIISPHDFNKHIPENIDLVGGDALLELQANAMATLANNNIPGTNTWVSVVNWLNEFLEPLEDDYKYIFFDLNPSFSIYTQVALAAADRLVLPVMADDSSRRAIQNAFSLVYGLKLPSAIYARHSFASRLDEAGQSLPKVHLVVKNRLTQYMGPASGFGAVLRTINKDVETVKAEHPHIFTFDEVEDGLEEVRDFQTTGVVAFARGIPFFQLSAKRYQVFDRRIQLNRDQIDSSDESIDGVVDRLRF